MRNRTLAKHARRQSVVPGTVILASASKQRADILKKAGIPFDVVKSGYQENLRLPLSPQRLVRHLALGKALAVAKKRKSGLIIGADTVVVLKGKVYGKPRSKKEAHTTLSRLSNRSHSILTGYAIVDAKSGEFFTRAISTRVSFRALSKKEIDAYVASGQGMKAAGAYAVQGSAAAFVRSVTGERSNIVGLPITALKKDLRKFS